MTPTIADIVDALAGLALLVVIVLLVIALRTQSDRRERAEDDARMATERRDVLANRLRAAGLDDVVELDAEIHSYADARRKAGA